MAHFFVGWDVGPWNCDEGNRRDAIAVLQAGSSHILPPIRTNIRELLVEHQREALLVALLESVGIRVEPPIRMTMAISTPLAWPDAVRNLLISRKTNDVPKLVDENPILFRKTELELLRLGHRPLSPVRDMIGSQSTKGMHFVRQAGFSQREVGLWRVASRTTKSVYEAVETIPTVLKRSPTFEKAFQPLLKNEGVALAMDMADKPARGDMERALRCALLASMYALAKDKLRGPTPDAPENEGWIWIPVDAEPTKKKK